MAQAETPLSNLPWMPTDEEDLHLKAPQQNGHHFCLHV